MSFSKQIKKILAMLGPGFITGASDDDPSGIATYAQTGAQFGLKQLFVPLYTIPFMIAIQEMCGRIGLVTGKGLAGVMKKHYSKTILWTMVALLGFANTLNIGADLGAMAESAKLLFPSIPFTTSLILFTILTLFLIIHLSYKTYAKILKWLTLTLFAYVGVAFIIKASWLFALYHLVIPTVSFDRETVLNIVALLGTTISPYLFFWQTEEEVDEKVGHKAVRVTPNDITSMRIDTAVGMIFSNIICFFIILSAAATLHVHGITTISSAADAAESLRPLAGNFAFTLFALGIIGTGMLAVPILAGSVAYAIAEACGWKRGINLKFHQAKAFYSLLIMITCIGAFSNILHIPPFLMLYYAAIGNGIAAPPLIALILHIGNDKKIMGKYNNSRLSNTVGILTGVCMSIAVLLIIF